MFNHTFIGLDVHAASVVGCALIPDTGELVRMQMDSDPAVVLDWIRHFEAPVKAVYESGPTGYALARFLGEAGIDCVVAASSKLLRAPGDKIKTDKRDARILAEMLALGQVTEVRVPTREQEDLRDLSRLRATASKNLAHAHQRVNAILLRHGIRYLDGTKWTRDHLAWLHRQRFDTPILQFTYEADVEQAELLAAHLKRIDQRVALVARDCEYADVINALMCLRGIQVTTGFGLAVEIGDWTRFTGATIGSYLGTGPQRAILRTDPAPGPDHEGRQQIRSQAPHRGGVAAPATLRQARDATGTTAGLGHPRNTDPRTGRQPQTPPQMGSLRRPQKAHCHSKRRDCPGTRQLVLIPGCTPPTERQ